MVNCYYCANEGTCPRCERAKADKKIPKEYKTFSDIGLIELSDKRCGYCGGGVAGNTVVFCDGVAFCCAEHLRAYQEPDIKTVAVDVLDSGELSRCTDKDCPVNKLHGFGGHTVCRLEWGCVDCAKCPTALAQQPPEEEPIDDPKPRCCWYHRAGGDSRRHCGSDLPKL